jgi:2,4-diketo-3-deoxy-L-fuconate hydrolase
LELQLRVNGTQKQHSNTSQMIFPIPRLIAELSKGMTLLPGDVIATGTPEGVGFARNPPEFLADGDLVDVEIERIGVLRNVISIG